MEIKIKHVATGRCIIMNGFGLSDYQDAVEAKYNHEPVYGRMDPITTYQGTSRKISMSIYFSGEATTMEKRKAFANFLMRLQYPVYSKYTDSNALAISRPPLVLVEFSDWIKGSKEIIFFDEQKFKPLLCAMSGFAYTPTVGFTPVDSPYFKRGGSAGGTTTPTKMSMKFDFTVLHEDHIGFDDQGIWTGGESWGVGDVGQAWGKKAKSPRFNEPSISPGEVNNTPNQSNAKNDQDNADARDAGVPGTGTGTNK